MKKLSGALAVVLALAATAPAAAQHGMAHPTVTRAGVQAQIGAVFSRADADRNGAVTRAEARAFAQRTRPGDARHADARFDRLDADRNGRLTLAEATAGPLAMFESADTNRDGTLNDAEMRAAAQAMRGARKGG